MGRVLATERDAVAGEGEEQLGLAQGIGQGGGVAARADTATSRPASASARRSPRGRAAGRRARGRAGVPGGMTQSRPGSRVRDAAASGRARRASGSAVSAPARPGRWRPSRVRPRPGGHEPGTRRDQRGARRPARAAARRCRGRGLALSLVDQGVDRCGRRGGLEPRAQLGRGRRRRAGSVRREHERRRRCRRRRRRSGRRTGLLHARRQRHPHTGRPGGGEHVDGVGELGGPDAPAGRRIGAASAGMATATGRPRAVATVVATRSRSSPAIAPETRVSGVVRGAEVSAPRTCPDGWLLSAAVARCMPAADAGESDRNLRHPPAGVGVVA